MALRRKKLPPLTDDEFTTYWPGDDAIDLAQSNLRHYCRTGDPSALAILPKHAPAEIRYRALTPREHNSILMAGINVGFEAFRIGIISIEGWELTRIRYPTGISGISDADLDELILHTRMELPWGHVRDLLREAQGERPREEEAEETVVSLPELVGNFILASTFRARRAIDSA